MKPAYFGLGAKEFVNVDDHCIHLSARVEHHCLGVCPVPEISISFVAIKMGRRQGARRAHPAPFLYSRCSVLSLSE